MNWLSERVLHMAESETLAMARMSRELKAQGHDVINLSLGEPDFDTPAFIKDAAKKAIDENYTHYTPVAGYDELLEAISTKFKRDNQLNYSKQQILVSTGAKQCIANVMLAILNKGDEVIVPSPYWVSYREIIKLAGGVSVEVYAPIEMDFKVTPEQIKNAITPNTKAIIFSSPSNPTGSLYTHDELKAIAKLLTEYPHIVVISDEIYELINFQGNHVSIGTFPGMDKQVVTINGLSKGFAMTGWRLGYMGAPADIAAACIKLQGQFTSATCSITQRAAITALKADPKEMDYMKHAFLKRRDLMYSLLQQIDGIKLNLPPGAFYFFPDVASYFGSSFGDKVIQNADDLCMYLLNHAHVATVPGSAFGAPDYIRLSYATSEEQLVKAIDRIKSALSQLKKL
jgi:aspartate aminotransferase